MPNNLTVLEEFIETPSHLASALQLSNDEVPSEDAVQAMANAKGSIYFCANLERRDRLPVRFKAQIDLNRTPERPRGRRARYSIASVGSGTASTVGEKRAKSNRSGFLAHLSKGCNRPSPYRVSKCCLDCRFVTNKLFEQRLGVFQIGSVEALGEPVVDLRQHRAPLITTTRVAQQAR